MSGLVEGADGRSRCAWGASTPDYLPYHDSEWGRPVTEDDAMFERLCLEAFQSGLSWLTILRRREGFRAAFAGFRISEVAAFGERDVERLLADPHIIRNRAKIVAAVENARAAVRLAREGRPLGALAWEYRLARENAPAVAADVPSSTAESTALAKELKRCGFRFVGPTTAYALMQATGIVNDHLAGCWVRGAVEAARRQAPVPTG